MTDCAVPRLRQALAVHFPQSLYYSLRTVLLSLREGMHRAQVEINKAKAKAQEEGVEFTREWSVWEESVEEGCEEKGGPMRIPGARWHHADQQPPAITALQKSLSLSLHSLLEHGLLL